MFARLWSSESGIAARRPKRLRVEPLEDREVPATFTVTTFADVVDPADGKLSLREAISRANATPGPDTIQLAAGVYNLTLTGADDLNAVGDFDVTDSLTINGLGKGLTVIQGDRTDRLFDVFGSINMTFNSLTLRDGGNPFSLSGGAVHAQSANITLNNGLAIGNVAIRGGAIDAETGVVTVRNSRLSNNSAIPGGGGAIFVGSGRLVIDRSTVSENVATRGGGILAQTATVSLSESTVKFNTAQTFGGGIDSEGGLVNLSNSSVRGNLAGADGGGIFADGTVNLTGSSVTGNRAGDEGGGIRAATVNLFGSTVAGNSGEDSGGGISSATAVLTNSTVRNNTVRGDGGGLTARTVNLIRSTVSGNRAGGDGGGIAADTATIVSSTIIDNSSGSLGGGLKAVAASLTNSTVSGNSTNGEGGGISAADTATLVGSTVSANTAGGNGGGIAADKVDLTNVTVSGNMAGASRVPGVGEGGGVSAVHGSILNSTIVENRSVGFVTSQGAGVFSLSGQADLIRVKNTIIAQNFDAFGQEQDVFGDFLSLGNNLVGEIDGGSTGFGAPGDLMGRSKDPLDPRLGPLAFNSGPTKTHALLAGSLAIDHGDSAGAPATDQRGVTRPRDGDGNGTSVIDIGAFER